MNGMSAAMQNSMREIIPTVVPASFDEVVAAKNRYSAFATQLHVDATDGIFAPQKTWLPMSGERLPDAQTLLYEAHLMINNPLSIGVTFARAGAKRVIAHVEAFHNAEHARETFDMWQKAGITEIGVALLLDTPLQELMPYMTLCDFVHVMTIAKVGRQGFKFDERGIDRVRDIHARYPDIVISTDGGETAENVDDLASVGATRFCIGSALAKAKDPAKEYSRLLNAVEVVK
jgi:ribulose-phosphate 3-epimerase